MPIQISENLSLTVGKFGQLLIDDKLDHGLLATFGYHSILTGGTNIIEDYAGRASSLIIEEFEQAEGIIGQVKLFADHIQAMEYTLNDILNSRDIYYLGDKLLDNVGNIVGESRKGRGDLEYRQAIYFRIFLNKSGGEANTIQNFLMYITNGTYARVDNIGSGKYEAVFQSISFPPSLYEKVKALSAGGVKPVLTNFNGTFMFGVQGDTGYPEDNNIRGCAELTFTEQESGHIVELLTN